MQIKATSFIFALALASITFAAPTPDKRAVTIAVTFRSSSGLQPQDPASVAPPAKDVTGKALKVALAKIAAKQKDEAARVPIRALIEHRAQILLNTAETHLGLPAHLPILVTDQFHKNLGTVGGSGDSDQELHASFEFHAVACGAGPCIAHVYNPVAFLSPGKNQPGKIFRSKIAGGGLIFGDVDI